MPLWHWKKFLFTSVNSLPFSWNPSPRRNAPTKSASLFPGFIFGRFFGFKNETPPKHQILKFDKIVLPHDFWYESIATSRDKLCQKKAWNRGRGSHICSAARIQSGIVLFSAGIEHANDNWKYLQRFFRNAAETLVLDYRWESSIQMSFFCGFLILLSSVMLWCDLVICLDSTIIYIANMQFSYKHA